MPLSGLVLGTLALGFLLGVAGLAILIFHRKHKRWGSRAIVLGFLLQWWWILLYAFGFLQSMFGPTT